MNDIVEILGILQALGGSATIEEILKSYCASHRMIPQQHYKLIIEQTLTKSIGYVRYNQAEKTWSVLSEEKERDVFSRCGFQKTKEGIHATEYIFSVNPNVALYLLPNKKVSVVIDPRSNPCVYKDFSYTSYHNSNMRKFPTENNGGKEPIHYGLKIEIESEEQLCSLLQAVSLFGRKPMIVCRVAHMKYYDGITEEDTPVNGGSYVAENNDAFEKNNFHEYSDGFCYGFIETKYKSGHAGENEYANAITIEKIDSSSKGKPFVVGVRVVMVAFSPSLKKTVVVGWYDNATVYRNRVVQDDKIYMVRCACRDAHLIPSEERTFEVPKAGGGNTFGIGQSNFWYIQRFDIARDFESKLTQYIESMI